MPEPEGHDLQAVMDALAEQVRADLAQPITAVVAAPRLGVGYWLVGIVGAVVVGVAVLIGAPMHGERRASAPPPAAEKVTLYAPDACTQRQVAIVAAISAYAHYHGMAPDDLSALGDYLSEPAVDPASGAPYLYSHDANTISVRCPNPELHTPVRVLRQPQLTVATGDQ